jgi:glucokinase
MSAYILGIDMGGTKSAAIVGSMTGEIITRVSGVTPAQEGSDAIVPFLINLGRQAKAQARVELTGIGISAGAPAEARRGLVFEAPNLPGWPPDGIPLATIFAEAFGIPAALENDADATALAEWHFGAGQGTKTMAFLTVGTGIGAGLILDGKLHRGATGAGGEIGHIAVEPEGRRCKCGLTGCLEAYSSGPSLTRIAIENGFTGEATGPAVVAAARAGDTAALAALETAGTMLGRGLATLCMLLNPERIVLGTLAVHAADLLMPPLQREITARTWSRLRENLQIVPAALGDRAQDLAALCVYLQRFPPQENAGTETFGM